MEIKGMKVQVHLTVDPEGSHIYRGHFPGVGCKIAADIPSTG
jgi:hypothetical protein